MILADRGPPMNGTSRASLVARAGAGLTAASGVVMAQGVPTTSAQGMAGIVTALCGVAMVFAPLYFKDRADVRNQKVKELERDVRDKARRIAELERVSVKIPVNEAHIASVQGETEALRETLHAKGWLVAPHPGPGQKRARTTVLIVEDDPDTARALMKLFTLEGFAPSYAPTMEEAVRLLEFGNPHWLILDMKVQGEDGLDLLRKIRGEGLTTRVAVITGTPDPARLEEARALGPDVLYRKPVDFPRLLRMILGPPADPTAEPPP